MVKYIENNMEERNLKCISDYSEHECVKAAVERCVIQIYIVYRNKIQADTTQWKLKWQKNCTRKALSERKLVADS